jgi:hypothetical protein
MKETMRGVSVSLSSLALIVIVLLVVPILLGDLSGQKPYIVLAWYGFYPGMGTLQYLVLYSALMAHVLFVLMIIPASIVALVVIVRSRAGLTRREMTGHLAVLAASWLLLSLSYPSIYVVINHLFG